jgi:hypothetical protein
MSFLMAQQPPNGPDPPPLPQLSRLQDHSQTLHTLGRTPLDEWSARRRALYLTKHNTHNRQTSMPTARFEPTIPQSEQPKIYSLDRAATGIGLL